MLVVGKVEGERPPSSANCSGATVAEAERAAEGPQPWPWPLNLAFVGVRGGTNGAGPGTVLSRNEVALGANFTEGPVFSSVRRI